MEKSILMRMISSIPIVGTALALWLEHTQLGTQHGKFPGLLRGLVVGLIIAATLIVASEAVVAAFDVGREWVSVHITAAMKAGIRARVIDEHNRKEWEKYQSENKGEVAIPDKPEQPEDQPVCGNELPIAGCFWAIMDESERGGFVVGVHDAIHRHYDGRQLFPPGTFAVLVKKLDQFYEDPAHIKIPVIDALREVRGN